MYLKNLTVTNTALTKELLKLSAECRKLRSQLSNGIDFHATKTPESAKKKLLPRLSCRRCQFVL